MLRHRNLFCFNFIFASSIKTFILLFVLAGAHYDIYANGITQNEVDRLLSIFRGLESQHRKEWDRQLMYVPRLLGEQTSLVDSERFYVSPLGKSNSEEEFIATIKMFSQSNDELSNDHPHCRYPGRLKWIRQRIESQIGRNSNPKCEALNQWLQRVQPRALSLVFSSYHLNNPASMFGHTFVMLHRAPQSGSSVSSPVLDSIVNFAANPTTTNPILYPILGLSGGFEGTFSLMPYYYKIQEYSSFESRDLWEYQLKLSQTKIDDFMYLLWEVGPHPIRYYYLDENCSFIMLVMLERIFPEKDFISGYRFYAIPADTLRSVTDYTELVEDVRFRPSSYSRFKHLFDKLPPNQKKTFQKFSKSKNIGDLNKTKEGKAEILDTAAEWIDFTERSKIGSGSEIPELRHIILSERAKIPQKSESIDLLDFNPNAKPDAGHKSALIRMDYVLRDKNSSGLSSKSKQALRTEISATLHKDSAVPVGYSTDLQIQMFAFELSTSLDQKNFGYTNLQSYDLFNSRSTPALVPTLSSPSWMLTLGGTRFSHENLGGDLWHGAHSGVGVAIKPGHEKVKLVGFLTGRVGVINRENNLGPLVGLGLQTHLFVDLSPTIRFSSLASWEKLADDKKQTYFERRWSSSIVKLLSRDLEINLSTWTNTKAESEFAFGFSRYW